MPAGLIQLTGGGSVTLRVSRGNIGLKAFRPVITVVPLFISVEISGLDSPTAAAAIPTTVGPTMIFYCLFILF